MAEHVWPHILLHKYEPGTSSFFSPLSLSKSTTYSSCLWDLPIPQSAPSRISGSAPSLLSNTYVYYTPRLCRDSFKGVSHTSSLLSNPKAAWCGCSVSFSRFQHACLGAPASIPASIHSQGWLQSNLSKRGLMMWPTPQSKTHHTKQDMFPGFRPTPWS